MLIRFTRLTNDRHRLEIVRRDGSSERVELETKSLWLHDLTHFAVESEAGLQDGFWGALAAGKTLAELNDRAGKGMGDDAGSLGVIEMLVGAISGALSGVPLESVSENIKGYFEHVGRGGAFPGWLTSEYVGRVHDRMRKLVGHWNGTKFGDTMELEWKES
jgi:hypothetical protein